MSHSGSCPPSLNSLDPQIPPWLPWCPPFPLSPPLPPAPALSVSRLPPASQKCSAPMASLCPGWGESLEKGGIPVGMGASWPLCPPAMGEEAGTYPGEPAAPRDPQLCRRCEQRWRPGIAGEAQGCQRAPQGELGTLGPDWDHSQSGNGVTGERLGPGSRWWHWDDCSGIKSTYTRTGLPPGRDWDFCSDTGRAILGQGSLFLDAALPP